MYHHITQHNRIESEEEEGRGRKREGNGGNPPIVGNN